MQSLEQFVRLRLDGDLNHQGFRVTFEIRGSLDTSNSSSIEGYLPPDLDLAELIETYWLTYQELSENSRFHLESIDYGDTSNTHEADLDQDTGHEDHSDDDKTSLQDFPLPSGSDSSPQALKQTRYHWQQNPASVERCKMTERRLKTRFDAWLKSDSLRVLERQLLIGLVSDRQLRIVICTSDPQIPKLPWHEWSALEEFLDVEVIFAFPRTAYGAVANPTRDTTTREVRLLAIFGDAAGIDLAPDYRVLTELPAEFKTIPPFLPIESQDQPQGDSSIEDAIPEQPNSSPPSSTAVKALNILKREDISDELWEQAWSILAFAGHSRSADNSGHLYISTDDWLDIADLKHAVSTAAARGLQLAIFNSCDGLGLAWQLQDVGLPYLIVMRGRLPDPVAHQFLRDFLKAYAQSDPPLALIAAFRQARLKLEIHQNRFPGATWLPVLYQFTTPIGASPLWSDIAVATQRPQVTQEVTPKRRSLPWQAFLCLVLLTTGLVLGIRTQGWLQPIELAAYDTMVQLQPREGPDPNILMVEITGDDLDRSKVPEQAGRRGSLSDEALLKLLQTLDAGSPAVIGLDIFRDAPGYAPELPELKAYLHNHSNLYGICNVGEASDAIGPTPNLALEQHGFSNATVDAGKVLRRQLLSMDRVAKSPCKTEVSLALQVANHFLEHQASKEHQKFTAQMTSRGDWQLGDRVLPRMQPSVHAGVYRNQDLWGNQILLRYRSYKGRSEQFPDRLPTEIFNSVTLGKVLHEQVLEPDDIKDKIVMIGAHHSETLDYFSTPFDHHQRTPGVHLQAQMVSQLVQAVLEKRSLIQVWPWWGDMLWIGFWAVLGGLAGQGLGALPLAWRWPSVTGLGLGILGVPSFSWVTSAPVIPGLLAFGLAWVALRFWLGRSLRLPESWQKARNLWQSNLPWLAIWGPLALTASSFALFTWSCLWVAWAPALIAFWLSGTSVFGLTHIINFPLRTHSRQPNRSLVFSICSQVKHYQKVLSTWRKPKH